MIWNWSILVWRNLLRQPLQGFINILGLALGLGAAILALLFVEYHHSFDRFFAHSDRIHQVSWQFRQPDGTLYLGSGAPLAIGDAFVHGQSDIEVSVRVEPHRLAVRNGSVRFEEEVRFVDPTFFEVFDFPLLAGDPTTALADRSGVVLTESLARKYFGDEQAVGRVLTIDNRHEARVSAVMRDPPINTHLDVSILLPFESAAIGDRRKGADPMNYVCCATYFRLAPTADPARVAEDLSAWYKALAPVINVAGRPWDLAEMAHPGLRPVTSLHLNADDTGRAPVVTRGQLFALTTIALLVLGIATFNFTNLATARAIRRAREVGVRKVVGAHRALLMTQFLSEAVFVALLALVVALSFVELLLPAYSAFVQADLDLRYSDPAILGALLGLAVLAGIGGGFYPAVILSGVVPARVLKGDGHRLGGSVLRKILIVAQFSVAIVLAVVTLGVHGQFRFAIEKQTGFDRENVVVLWGTLWGDGADEQRRQLLERLRADPDIVSVAASGLIPVNDPAGSFSMRMEDGKGARDVSLTLGAVGFGFFETLRIPVIAGRSFEEGRGVDQVPRPDWAARGEQPPAGAATEVPGTAIVNRAALKALGYSTPEEALGADILFADSQHLVVRRRIVGVVEDFHARSVHDPIKPTFFFIEDRWQPSLLLRLRAGDPAPVLRRIDKVWSDIVPDELVRRQFMSVELQQLYEKERRMAILFAGFSGLAIAIACLGLFALSAFSAQQRTREIGLRKVLGATVPDIVRLLAWQFSKPVLVSNLVAWPIAWIAINAWLEGFAYRIDLTLLPFLLAGGGALLIAWATVALHAFRVAQAKPITALRCE